MSLIHRHLQCLSLALLVTAHHATAAPGALDSSFGTSGKVVTSVSTGWDWADAMTVQPDGKIIVVGFTDTGTATRRDVAVLRYLPNGSLDTSFGGTGKVVTSFGNDDDYAVGVAVLADGKIMVGGTSYGASKPVILARYNANGSLDTTFNSTGKVVHDPGISVTINAMTMQADGKIVLVGETGTFPDSDFLVMRYNANGTPDTTFGGTGRVITKFGTYSDTAYGVVVQPDGKLLVTGTARTIGFWDVAVVRYNTNGSLDTSFNATGKVMTDYAAGNDEGDAIALQADGKIVVAGAATDAAGDSDVGLFRYNPNGSLDTTFNGTGKSRISLGTYGGQAEGLAIQPDGKIVVGGDFVFVIGNQDFFTARFTSAGVLDSNFGTGGITKTAIGAGDDVFGGFAVQPNGNILLTGFTVVGGSRDIPVVRYLAAAPAFAVFNGASTAAADKRVSNGPAFLLPNTPLGSSSAAQTFTVSNPSDVPFSALAVTITGALPGDFSVDTSGMATTLAPGASTTFTATFTPTAEGTRAATLQISTTELLPFFIPVKGFTQAANFTITSLSKLEDAATVTVPVSIGIALGEAFTVPVTFSGTGMDGIDYTHIASPLKFTATQTVSNLTITIKDELLVEGAENVVATLGTPSHAGVAIGTSNSFTLTLEEDDVMPVISPLLGSQIVAVGDPVAWNSGATGSNPLALKWKKNTTVIAGAITGSYSIAAAALTDAAAYTLTASNQRGSLFSTAQLAVVDQTSLIIRANVGSTASLTAPAKGNLLTYQWRDGLGAALANSTKFAGVTTSKLTIKSLVPADTANFTCMVTGPGGALPTGTFDLQVPSEKPIAIAPALPDGVISNAFTYQLPFDTAAAKAPTKFVCSGLPTGLTCSATTGLITGKPTRAGSFTVNVTLSNSAGSADITVSDTMTVFAFNGAGTHVGLVSRHAASNNELGGRVDLTVSATGSFTGKLLMAGVASSLKGAFLTPPTLNAVSSVDLQVSRGTGRLPVVLSLDFDPMSQALTGDVVVLGDVSGATVNGWRNKWRAAPVMDAVTAQLGTHAMRLEPVSMVDGPQGYGFGTVKVTTAGVASISGKSADGGVISCSAPLGPAGEVFFHQMLYTNHGSLQGFATIASDASHTVTGTLDWKKTAAVLPRDYAAFGPVGVTLAGGLFMASKPVLGLSNAQFTFSDAGLASPLSYALTVGLLNQAILPVGSKLSAVSLTSATGLLTGKLTLPDVGTTPRVVTFQAQLSPTLGHAYGYMLLPQLPSPPTTTTKTSPILSGKVVFGP